MILQLSTSEQNNNLSPFAFEVLCFRLMIDRQTATGFDDAGTMVSHIDSGAERLSPRAALFSGDPRTWCPPSGLQVRALLYNLKTIKTAYQTMDVSANTFRKWSSCGIQKFHFWRQLLDILRVPHEPYIELPLKSVKLWDSINEPESEF